MNMARSIPGGGSVWVFDDDEEEEEEEEEGGEGPT